MQTTSPEISGRLIYTKLTCFYVFEMFSSKMQQILWENYIANIVKLSFKRSKVTAGRTIEPSN